VVEGTVVLGRQDGPQGEVLLRRRDGIEELIVNGVFAMDSAEHSTEDDLARIAVAGREPRRVLVGGLGLGYTVSAVLRAAPTVQRVDVVELEDCLVEWARQRVTPGLAAVADDGRVRLHVADVSDVLAGRTGPARPWDAVLLDVDNGPDFLIHAHNAALYAPAGLAGAAAALAPGGTLAVWCQGVAPDLLAALRRLDGRAEEHRIAARRGSRRLEYAVYTLTRP
jgi:spermidine synthase